MATVSIPVGGIQWANTTGKIKKRVGGATLSEGDLVYADTTDDNELKATDVTAAASAVCDGILAMDTADGEGAIVLGNGCEISGPTFTEGTAYVVDNSGAISEFSDLASSEYHTRLGYGDDAGNLIIDIEVTGETK